MPTFKENPRYNVVSGRLTDEEKARMSSILKGTLQSDFVRQAITEKIEREEAK